MQIIITPTGPLRGTVRVPSDKAICHRVALVGAVGRGRTVIEPWSSSEDCRRTLELVRQLGVAVTQPSPERVELTGAGLNNLASPRRDLDCGESGTTMRLACGLLAGQPFNSHLTAAPSLTRRPMHRVIEPLSRMGARIEGRSRSGAPEAYPPLLVHGRRPLGGLDFTMTVPSAQVKSAILLAGLFSNETVRITEPLATRDHTERLLTHLGANLHREGRRISLEPPRELRLPPVFRIPGDASSAAFFVVAAALVPGSRLDLPDVSLNPSRAAFLDVLGRMGARLERRVTDEAWEPRGQVTVSAGPLEGVHLGEADAPSVIDELPILMVAAACAAKGESVFAGLQELRVKETDRLASMTQALRAMDADLELSGPAELRLRPGRLRGAVVDSHGDHRTVMSVAVAALCAEGPTTIRGAECVAKSFPTFFELLASVAGPGTVQTKH